MRNLTRAIVVAGLFAAWSGSAAFGAEPTTRPAAGKVVVLPFTQANPGPSQAWVGQSIRQGVLADLMPYAPGRVNAFDQPAADDQAAIDAARKAGAAYAVTGSVVTVGPEVRFNGQVLDVDGGKPLAPLKATGSVDDLYAMQNALAEQLGRAIGLTMAAGTPTFAAPASTDTNAWGTNDYLAANPYGSYGGGAAGAGSDFGNYGYGAWPYAWPVFVTSGRGRHDHAHGGGSGDAAVDSGTPFGQFIPTNRAQSLTFNEFGGSGSVSIAGGGGNAALNGGIPYGQFIPTNRTQSRRFNAFGGSGTVSIAGQGPRGSVGRAASGRAASAGRR